MLTASLPTLNQFWRLLRNHDWTFEYSDDSSVWRRGSSELNNIRSIIKEGGEEYEKLFQEYSRYAWRKDNSIQEPIRPQPTKQQQLDNLEILNHLAVSLDLTCNEVWSIEADQITSAEQLWNIFNPLTSMISKIRDIIDEKSKSSTQDTVASKGYKRIKEQLDRI